MIKSSIKQKLIEIQEQIINDLKERVKGYYELVDLDDNDTLDSEDFSHQNESSEMEQLLQKQLEKPNRNLLKSIQLILQKRQKLKLVRLYKRINFHLS